jgi:hypothetical protein
VARHLQLIREAPEIARETLIKKFMKNLFYLFAAVVLAFMMTGCGTTNSSDNSGGAGANPNTPPDGGAATGGMH